MDLTHSKVLRDARAISRLTKGHEKEIGFIPDTVYAPALLDGRCITTESDNDPIGFILRGPTRPVLKIFQTLIDPEWQRATEGSALLMRIIAHAADHNCERISLHCATDLDANQFWQAMQFTRSTFPRPGVDTRRPAWRWTWRFPRGEQLDKYLTEIIERPKYSGLADLFRMRSRLEACHTRRFRRRDAKR